MLLYFFQLADISLAEDEAEPEAASNRIDFGNSYVSGQSIKSGAVYLMNRKKNEITSMLKPRESYRTEILDEYPEISEAAPASNK